MHDTIFREYDIRGEVGSEFIIDQSYDLACAIAFYCAQKNPVLKTVAVGMDGRTHSPVIKEQICKALQDSGLDVVFVGVCPSPVVYFTPYVLPVVDAGIMITASHNPKEYNGLKLCLGKDFLWGNQIREIRDCFKQRKRINAEKKGALSTVNVIDCYTDWLADHFKHLRGMSLSVVVDCGNGTAGTVFPLLIEKMNWSHVQLLYPEVDGTYPHHEADPVVEKNMLDVKKILAETDIELGIGLDGDCDRMAPMTKDGYLVPGDKLMALFSKEVVQHNPGAAIVFDIKSSSGLVELLEQWGAKPCMSPSGHAIIKSQMKKHKALLGGELSCHFFFNDRYFGYDDGIYAALRLFEHILHSGEPLHQLLSFFPRKVSSPEIRISCSEKKIPSIIKDLEDYFSRKSNVKVVTIDGIRVTMKHGWGIVRGSNTQPVLCMRFESDTKTGLQKVKDDFFNVLQPHFEAKIIEQLK